MPTLNWAVMGWRLILEVGFEPPPCVDAAIEAYRFEADIIGVFLSEYTIEEENSRLSTSLLYSYYAEWAKANGYKPLSSRNFVADLRRRFEIRSNGHIGNAIMGYALVSGGDDLP